MNPIEILIEDYKLLREESLQSMKNRNAILTFGLATLGFVIHAGVSSFTAGNQSGYWFSFFIFYLGLPLVSLLILILWVGEAARMSRTGIYMKEREVLVNLLSGSIIDKYKNNVNFENDFPKHYDKVLYWENYIREKIGKKKTRQLKFPYLAVLFLFFGISLGSIIVSFKLLMPFLCFSTKTQIILLTAGIIIFSVVSGLIIKKCFEME